MPSRIEQLQDAVLIRIGELDLPAEVDVEANPFPLYDTSKVRTKPLCVISPGGMTFERTGRGATDLLRRSQIVVAVYSRIAVDTQTGLTDKVALDKSNALLEALALQLADSWLNRVANDPPPEIRQFYKAEMVMNQGTCEAVVIVSFAEDVD